MKLTIPKTIARFAGAALLVAASICTARADYASTLQALGPVAYWPFTETAPSPAPFVLTNYGSVGPVADAHATSTCTNGVPGIVGNALQFSNPSGASGYGTTFANVYYNPGLNTPAFSVEFWAKPTALDLPGSFDATGCCPISNFNPNNFGASRAGWLFYLAPSGQWSLRLGLTSGYAAITYATNFTATANTWQHVVATYDGSTIKLYVNGTQYCNYSSSAALTGWAPNPGSFLRFGNNPLFDNTTLTADGNGYLPWNSYYDVSGNRGYDGLLDEIAVYTNVLSPATIAAHYAAAATPATYDATILAAQPAGYWNFDEPAITAPNPATLPFAANSGSLGSSANGTNGWGAVAAQAGPSYPGFPAGDKAVAFDGYTGSLTVKDAPGLHFTNSISLVAWVKPLADNYVHDIIEQGFDGAGQENFLRITRGYGNGGDQYGNLPPFINGAYYGYYEVGATEGENNNGWYDSALFPIFPGDLGNWVFLVGTFDGTDWNLYRDGVLVAQYPAYGTPGNPNMVGNDDADTGAVSLTNSWTIGSRALPTPWDGNNFAGSIAEPAIFTNTLSASDVMALYVAAKVPPVITTPPQNPGLTFKNASVSFTVSADGAPTLGYLWTSNGIPTSDTTTSYSIAGIQDATYTVGVIVTNAYGTNSASVTFPVVSAPPVIVTPPVAEERFVGYPFTLSVGVSGTTPLSYYWYQGGTLVQAGSSASYTVASSGLANSGSYSVVVTNETSVNVTSAPVAVTISTVPGGYPAVVVASGPLAYWRVDEAPGTGTAFDRISGIDGIYYDATLGVPGYSVLDPDTAVSFSGDNSYIGNISGTAINFINNSNFTVEAWVNAPAGQNDEATIMAKGIGTGGGATQENEQFALDVAGGVYRFFTTYGNTTGNDGNKYEADAGEGPNGTWQHVVGVYDGQNNLGGGAKLYIYVNGVQEGSYTVPTKGQNPITTQVSIGSKMTGNSPVFDGTFDGTIDEVAVYSYALSSSTINAHYAAAYGTTLAPIIGVEPVATTNYAGLPITLSVVAAGSVPVSYQWYQNGVALNDENPTPDGGYISGSQAATLYNSQVAYSDAGNYYVKISNNINTTNSVTVPVVVLAPPTTPPVIPGLVVHLPFNGSLADVTGRGNNGIGLNSTYNPATSTGTTNTVSPTPSNPSFFFTDSPFLGTNTALHYATYATNGAAKGLDDYYVSLGVRPDLQFGSNINFTVSYWVRTILGYGLGAAYGGGGDLPFFTTALGSLGGNGFDFATAYAYGTQSPPTTTTPNFPGCWATSMYGSGSGVRIYGGTPPAPSVINDGNWHNLINVVDRSTGKITTYLDGVLTPGSVQGGTTLDDARDIDTGNPATIGQDPTGLYGELGSADISDLGVWRKALTPLEAASIYIAGVSNQLSYAYEPSGLTATETGTTLTLNWTLGTLQSSTNVAGPFTDVPGATAPYETPSNMGNNFFRLRYTYQ
jgi:hypothetical protein